LEDAGSTSPLDEPTGTEGGEDHDDERLERLESDSIFSSDAEDGAVEGADDWVDVNEHSNSVSPRDSTSFGCSHYERRCKIVAPCCNEVFWCRHCHNVEKNEKATCVKKAHELDRFSVTEIVCASCGERQPHGKSCRNIHCSILFASYYCDVCKFWDNKGVKKEVFHCDKCGICRVGGRDNFFHCDTCGGCYALKANHKCIENAMTTNCPICLEDIFQSVKTITPLPCGHMIHSACWKAMSSINWFSLSAIRCPICSKSFTQSSSAWWRMIDDAKSTAPLPEELCKTVSIGCNDCDFRGESEYHPFGLKCGKCGGYNTYSQEDSRTAPPSNTAVEDSSHSSSSAAAAAAPPPLTPNNSSNNSDNNIDGVVD